MENQKKRYRESGAWKFDDDGDGVNDGFEHFQVPFNLIN